MLDLIRDGVKAAEGLVTLPLRAANEISGPHNPTFGEILSLTERLVRMPFALVRRSLGDSDADLDTLGADPSRIRRSQNQGQYHGNGKGGPGMHNLAVSPKTAVLSDLENPPGSGLKETDLKVTGLLCGL